jgi:protein-S-isoprenylcysteine O-methyltransferase Ste14
MQRFLLSAFYAALISLGPVMLIYHRSLDTFWTQQSWQNIVFYILYTFFAAIAVNKKAQGSSENSRGRGALPAPDIWHGCFQAIRNHEFAIFISVYFFFYVACCALCQKLNFTQLSNQTWASEVWKTLGLLIVLWAMTIQVNLIRLDRIVHPLYFSYLLLLVGLPLLFSAWMPLLAVPGAFIIFKWHINMQNRRLNFLLEPSEDGTTVPKESHGKGDWQILPYIF